MFPLQIGNEGLAADLTDDPDTEEALKEFDFLVTAEDGEGAGEARSSGDGTEWGKVIKKYRGGKTSRPYICIILNLVCGMCVSECMLAVQLRARRRVVFNNFRVFCISLFRFGG